MLRLVGGELYQWDTYRKIAIDDPDNLITEIHYARDCDETSIVITVKQDSNGVHYAEIPNILLQYNCPIYAYAVNVNNGERKTIVASTFIVKQKAKPADYIYEETEVLCYGELDQKIDRTKGELETQIDETKTELNAKIKDVAQKAYKTSVEAYGAKGDGVTDDTEAFKQALAKNRLVYVPEGNYVISQTLVIRENCELELAQSAVLNFTQTTLNCITLLRLASLKGNHATIRVPYDFSASVLYSSTEDDYNAVTDENGDGSKATEYNEAVKPFTMWDPQWKMSRYVTDVNICKANSKGFHYSNDGKTNGKAVSMVCSIEEGGSNFMWGVNMSGLRIAGAFDYGIYIYNEVVGNNKRWNHDMRIEAVIDACKTGAYVENCNTAHLALSIQPRAADNGTVYGEHGIHLKNSKWVDLSSCFVWDKQNIKSGFYKFAFEGECPGIVLSVPNYNEDKNVIYTNNQSNIDNMTLLQNGGGSDNFTSKNGKPYFSSEETGDKELLFKETFDSCFDVDIVKNFNDLLAVAEDTDGTILDDKGYKLYARLHENGTVTNSSFYGYTGFIPCKKGDVIYAENLTYAVGDDYCKAIFYDTNKDYVMHVNRGNIISNSHELTKYTESENGFSYDIIFPYAQYDDIAYVRFTFHITAFGANPMIAVNEEIKYEPAGFLADSVKVKAENVVGLNPSSNTFIFSVSGDEENGYTSSATFEEITAEYNKGRDIICSVPNFGFEDTISYGYLFRVEPNNCFEFNINGGIEEFYIAIYPDEIEVTGMNGEIKIGDKTYYGDEPIDFTDTINEMIDEKVQNAGGADNEVVWITCDFIGETLQASNFSHTYDEIVTLLNLGKALKVKANFGAGYLYGDVVAHNTSQEIVFAQVMVQNDFGAGLNLYYYTVEIVSDGRIIVKPYIVNTTSIGG